MWKSILKPENSAIAGIATVGLVYGNYQLNVGSLSSVHMSEANHPALETSRKKAGWSSLVMVAGLTLITKDANIGILGFASIIAMEALSRHSIMTDASTGQIQNPNGNSAYAPAENVIPMWQQAPAV